MPKFSIIIPVYKVEKYLRQCLDSVVNQTFGDFEALIVDDCGGDGSLEIAQEYAQKDSRLVILRHECNKGLASARNTALDYATGKYIVCLDSDDWLSLNCLEVLHSEFQLRKTESIWFNAYRYLEKLNTTEKDAISYRFDGYKRLTPKILATHSDFSWIKAYTLESIKRYNLRWPDGLTFEDGEFYFKYFTYYPVTYVISDCLYYYRKREGSIVDVAMGGKLKVDDIFAVIKHMKEFWQELGVYDYRYKETLLKLIQHRISMCSGVNYNKDNIRSSKRFIEDMNYPQDYNQFLTKNKNPLVTVVVPVYNVEKYVKECLDSIINQTYKNLEIICVDDCGQDDSINIVKEIAKTDKRIKVIHHKKNKGLGGARNTGLKNAQGEFIFFVDSDDFIEKDCVEVATNTLLGTQYNVVFFKTDVLWENTQQRTPIWYQPYADYKEGDFVINEDNMCEIPCFSWNKAYRTSFLKDNNIKWQEGVIYEDQDFSYRVFTKSPETYMIDKVLYVYRRREGSIISENYSSLKNVEDLYKAAKRIYDYLVENDLIEKYKVSFFNSLCCTLNNYRINSEVHKKLLPLMLKCLEDVNFMELYKKESL